MESTSTGLPHLTDFQCLEIKARSMMAQEGNKMHFFRDESAPTFTFLG